MKLIAQRRGKNEKYDRLRYVRADGSETSSEMPRQGILPHDLVHYVVESGLPLRHGFLSLVAKGADAGFVMDAIHDKTNLQVEIEAVQTEAIVEALQSQLWSGVFDIDAFLDGVRGACEARQKPVYVFAEIDPEELYHRAIELNRQWMLLENFQSLELDFPH
jgi:hypothetical protein